MILKLKPIIGCILSLILPLTIVIVSRSNSINFSLPPSPKVSTVKYSSSFMLWLHGLGTSGASFEPLKSFFKSPEFNNTKWSFPTAPSNPVTCLNGTAVNSWFDIPELPITSHSPNNQSSLLEAVSSVHAMLDKEIASGTIPNHVFICGFSQGAALTLASALMYSKTLGGAIVFSGWLPFDKSLLDQMTPRGKKTPILMLHGTSDNIVFFEAGEQGFRFVNQVGGDCQLKAYMDLVHKINDEEMQFVQSWIKSRL